MMNAETQWATADVHAVQEYADPRPRLANFWTCFAGIAVLVIIAAGTCWIFEHPYAASSDEAAYINQVQMDVQRLMSGKIVRFCGRILLGDPTRPPAYRIMAIPALALVGFRTATARLISLTLATISLGFIYLTGRRVASSVAGAVAVLFFFLVPEVVIASAYYGTEGPLFLAISATLYFLSAYWIGLPEGRWTWVALGSAMGLGLLSKASYILIIVPVAVLMLTVGRRWLAARAVSSLLKSAVLGFAIAAPWWILNLRTAMDYAKVAVQSPRNSLGPASFHIWVQWMSTIVQGLLGYGLTALLTLIAASTFYRVVIKRETIFDRREWRTIVVCVAASAVTFVTLSLGVNHLLRYLTPILIPLSLIVGITVEKTGWARNPRGVLIVLCFIAQILMISYPIVFPNTRPVDPGFVNGGLPWRQLVRFEQWNWEPLREISDKCGIARPRISFLGNGRAFNANQIDYPWIVQRREQPYATWLWRYEDGPYDAMKIWSEAARSDIVITAPEYVGQVSDSQDLDNQYNVSFADHLAHDSRFHAPIHLRMGRFQPVEVLVFLNSAAVCQL